jgi:hypothetical protein
VAAPDACERDQGKGGCRVSAAHVQSSRAPAAAHAFMSATAVGLSPPPGGMFPPYHERQDCDELTSAGLGPLMYPWLRSQRNVAWLVCVWVWHILQPVKYASKMAVKVGPLGAPSIEASESEASGSPPVDAALELVALELEEFPPLGVTSAPSPPWGPPRGAPLLQPPPAADKARHAHVPANAHRR